MPYFFDITLLDKESDRTVLLSGFQFSICLDTAWVITEAGGNGI